MKFSVLMSVYSKEKTEYFISAIESVLNQTMLPDEIVLMRDGKVPKELQNCIDGFLARYPSLFTYVPLEENIGLGSALNKGVVQARNEWIFRMDTDDISVPDRFEKQIAYIKEHPEIDVVGGQIEEFIGDPQNVVSKRSVPLEHNEIIRFMKVRNPINHMTVAFKKKAVLNAGNYVYMHYVEDYYLWCRMFLKGHRFENLPETLVYVRIGKDMYRRRGGYKYFCSLRELERFKLKNKMIGWVRYCETICARLLLQVVCSASVRGYIYKKVGQKKAE